MRRRIRRMCRRGAGGYVIFFGLYEAPIFGKRGLADGNEGYAGGI